ncbi:MAG TPA: ABC-2 transporter permease [Bryobacteraceae bacterium]|nr:ABC-2 transporter permease [Bryobacteraceae bacterium]
MRGAVVRQLILKDWALYRGQLLFSIAGGAIALGVVQWRHEAPILVGIICFFSALILVGHMLPIVGIVNERKNQNLAFLMSLPVSSIQYTTAKLISTFGMFLIPWLTLLAAAVLLIETRGFVPRAFIPLFLILAFLPFIGTCLITGVALVGETEGWGLAANVFCNIVYSLAWPFLIRIPGLMPNATVPKPVWHSNVFRVLGVEVGLIVLILALTYYLQSKKRDFI